LLLAILAACTSTPKQPTAALNIPSDSALSTIEQLIANHRYIDAEDALKKVDIYSLSEIEQIQFHWLSANLSVQLGRGNAAINSLNAVPPGAFTKLSGIDPNGPGFLRAASP
jgi:hypothetical protein